MTSKRIATTTAPTEHEVRLERMQQLQAELDAAVSEVERHRRELDQLQRKIATITRAIHGR